MKKERDMNTLLCDQYCTNIEKQTCTEIFNIEDSINIYRI